MLCLFGTGLSYGAAGRSLSRIDKAILVTPWLLLLAKIARDKLVISHKPDASSYYRSHFDEALRAYGVKDPGKVPLKNDVSMSDLGETTFYGVRIKEPCLEELSEAQRIHTCWHEAAHYVLGHLAHKLKHSLALPVVTSGLFLLDVFSNNKFLKNTVFVGGALALLYHGFKAFKYLSWPKSPYEKEADALAMEHHIKTGKSWVIEDIRREYEQIVIARGFDDSLSPLQKELARQQAIEHCERWNALYAQACAKIDREAKAVVAR
jgi:hypothetical protein